MARDSYAARVRRGVDFLDNTVNDNWHLKIDLDSLNLSDGAHCILGQLWESQRDEESQYASDNYIRALKALGIDESAEDGREVDLGFNVDEDHTDTWLEQRQAYRWLTIRWRQAIEAKRAQA